MSLVTGKASELLSKYANAKQFLLYTRYCLPIMLHCCSICYMDILYFMPKAIPPDYSTILFATSTSEILMKLDRLHLEDVDMPHQYVDNTVKVLLTCLYTDLALRCIWIPMEYIIYYLCMHGFTTLLLKVIAPFVPSYFGNSLIILFNYAETETGCIYAKDMVATIIFVVVFIHSPIYKELLLFLNWVLLKILHFLKQIWGLLRKLGHRQCWLF